MPSRRRLKPAEIALFVVPVLVGLLIFALARLRPPGARNAPAKPRGYSFDTVALSPDGQFIATGDRRGTIQWWNVRDGKCAHTLQAAGGWCICLAWSPDGRTFAATTGNKLILFDGRTGRQIRVLMGNQTELNVVSFSPDSKLIAVGSDTGALYWGQGKVRLWEVETGRAIASLGHRLSGLAAVDFSPDGKSIALYAGADRRGETHVVQCWDLGGGKSHMRWEKTGKLLGGVRWLPGGNRILVGDGKPTALLATTGEIASEFRVSNGEGTWYLTLQAGGEVVAGDSNSHGQPLTFWDSSTGELAARGGAGANSFGSGADAFAFSQDEKHCVYVDGDCNVQLWDTKEVDLKKLIDEPGLLDKARRVWVLDTLSQRVEIEP